MFRKLPFIYLILPGLLAFGCRRVVKLPETMEAHFVKYQIEYLEVKAGDIPTRILPAQMDSYYTKYFVMTKIEGFFSQFSLVQIADLKQKRVTTQLNFFGNKVYCLGEQGELPAGIKEPEFLNYTFTKEKSVIGGLNSEKVEIDTGEEKFDIYYTRDFSVRRPNISTPFQTIDYPLSDFQIQLSLLKMHLTCVEYQTKIIESDIFTVPDDYKLVTRDVMEEIINSLFTNE